jgi:hypothetical protein
VEKRLNDPGGAVAAFLLNFGRSGDSGVPLFLRGGCCLGYRVGAFTVVGLLSRGVEASSMIMDLRPSVMSILLAVSRFGIHWASGEAARTGCLPFALVGIVRWIRRRVASIQKPCGETAQR